MIIAIYELNGKKLKKLKQEPTILFQQEFEGSIKEAESILDEQLREEEVIETNDIVLHHFKNPKTGFPKFKSKKFDKKSYTTNNVNNSIRIISQNHIQLPKLGVVKFVEHRRIPKDYTIKSV